MTVRQAAERLEISASLTYALLASGKLKGTRHGLGRGTWRVSEAQLAAYLAECEAEPRLADGPLHHIR